MEGSAMTSSTPWLGPKRVAFVPLFRSNAAPPDQVPPDWEDAILRRVIDDSRPQANGADRSLRAWLRTASSGLADIDPLVLPMQTIDRQNVEADDLEGTLGGRLRDQGMDAAVLVMLGGRGSGNNRGFWSRVVMKESNGVWLMELIHGLTGFKDLYPFDNDVDPPERAIDSFDEMSAQSQTHPTAFTKNELGWLDAAAIPLHTGASVEYELQHIGLAQPPPAGRAAAIRIGNGFPYVMAEARKMTDQFEAGMPSTGDEQERGIASEGVIAYRIQTRNPTANEREGKVAALPADAGGLAARPVGDGRHRRDATVTGEIPDGFTIRIDVRSVGLFVTTDGNGNITDLRQHPDWDRDWNLIVPGTFGGSGFTDLLFYRGTLGEGLFVTTNGNGNITDLRQHLGWDRDWDLIVPGNFGRSGFTDLLFYRRSVGEGLFVTTDGNGNITDLRQHTDWDRDWDLIIPGNFGDTGSPTCCSTDMDDVFALSKQSNRRRPVSCGIGWGWQASNLRPSDYESLPRRLGRLAQCRPPRSGPVCRPADTVPSCGVARGGMTNRMTVGAAFGHGQYPTTGGTHGASHRHRRHVLSRPRYRI
jgi:hypothetical protein